MHFDWFDFTHHKSTQGKQRGFIPIYLLILLLVSGLAGYYYVTKSSVKPISTQPTPTVIQKSTDETANWKTYTNAKYKFSIKYPASYIIKDSAGVILIADKQASFTEASGFITIDTRLKGVYADYDAAVKAGIQQFKEDKVENIENGIKFTSKPYILPFIGGGKQQLYRLNIYWKYNDGAITASFNNEPINNSNKYDKILSTFKFTN